MTTEQKTRPTKVDPPPKQLAAELERGRLRLQDELLRRHMTEGNVIESLVAVMTDIIAVAKDQRNQQQNYSFRGVDAVVNAVSPALRKHRVITLPVVEEAKYRDVLVGKNQSPMRECTLKVRYFFYGPKSDHVESVVYAEALDSGDKATAKAHSVAYRTCLLQVFCIPTDEPDPDASSPERSPAAAPDEPPLVNPISEAWRRTREAIERGFPRDRAEEIRKRLGADLNTVEGATSVAEAVERFEKTAEMPPETKNDDQGART